MKLSLRLLPVAAVAAVALGSLALHGARAADMEGPPGYSSAYPPQPYNGPPPQQPYYGPPPQQGYGYPPPPPPPAPGAVYPAPYDDWRAHEGYWDNDGRWGYRRW
jgi:hypothetical protein